MRHNKVIDVTVKLQRVTVFIAIQEISILITEETTMRTSYFIIHIQGLFLSRSHSIQEDNLLVEFGL